MLYVVCLLKKNEMSNYSEETKDLIKEIENFECEKMMKIWEFDSKIEKSRVKLRERLNGNKVELLLYLSLIKLEDNLSEEMKACVRLLEEGVFDIADERTDSTGKFILWLNRRGDESAYDYIKRNYEHFKENVRCSNQIIRIDTHSSKEAYVFYFAFLKKDRMDSLVPDKYKMLY